MGPFRIVTVAAGPLLYLAAVAAVAAILAYAVTLSPLDLGDFNRLVSRGAQMLLLLSLIPLAIRNRLTRREIGLPESRSAFARQAGIGLLIGLIILSIHVLILLGLGAIKPNPEVPASIREIAATSANALWAGLLVAAIEESIFRGVLFAYLARRCQPLLAAVIGSFYFAILHFFKSDIHPVGDQIHWFSGFAILGEGMRHLMTQTRLDSLLALFLAGLFLSAVRLKYPRGLAYCIGIHAGWVVVIKTGRRLTNPDPHAPMAFLIGSYDQIIGYGAAAWILLLLAAFWLRSDSGRRADPAASR